jgi:hypothetical protein
MAKQTYGRGQVEWALWRSFVRTLYANQEMPKAFRTRIKRLLDIDRELDLGNAEELPEADYAFAPPVSDKSGEVGYRAVDAFSLAIGLDLLDAGFKQGEVVFLMRYLRTDLEQRFPKFLERPSLINRQRHLAKNYPSMPSFKDGGTSYADGREFVILQKLELTEIIPLASGRRPTDPVFLEPVYCAGATALGEKLSAIMPEHRRAVTILELAATAQAVQSFLNEAPVIRRGRPRMSKV